MYLIADEVMSGFGRCGEWFAWQRHGEAGRPDLMTLAKGLTGAHLPLGAVVALRARSRPGSSTSGSRPASPTAATPSPARRGSRPCRPTRTRASSSARAPWARGCSSRLRAMQDRLPVIGDVRGGHGLFAVVELVKDRATREPVSRLAPRRTRPSRRS